MDINIQAIRFEASEKLIAFIEKKVSKLSKFDDKIRKVEVSLKVVKPETAMNKEVALQMAIGSTTLYADKVCDTFEEAIDDCVETLQRQISKYKEKQKSH